MLNLGSNAMFNNLRGILNRKGEQARSPNRSESLLSRSSDEAGDDTSNSAEGFLCPLCLSAFPSADTLQDHYESKHTDGISEVGEGAIVFCPVCKMKLGSEVELKSHCTRHHAGQKDDIEFEAMRMQVQALEESKNLLQDELHAVRLRSSELQKENVKVREERDSFELKAAKLAGELANLKASYDELNTKKLSVENSIKSYEEKMQKLEAEIQQRPEADDVNLLKQEIVTVQKMMDQLTLQREAEKDTLQKQCDNLQDTCLKLQSNKTELETKLKACPNKEDIESLQEKVSKMSANISQLQREIDHKEVEKKKLELTLEKYSNYEELKIQLKEKHNLLQESKRITQEKADLIDKLKKELQAEKAAVEDMKVGREKLFSKIEEGEGANTAILQLKEENARLQEQFLTQQTLFGQTAYENDAKMDEVRSQLAKTQREVQALEDKNKEFENEIASIHKENNQAAFQKELAIEDLNSQLDNLMMTEKMQKLHIQKLEEETESCKNSLLEKTQALEELQNAVKEEKHSYKTRIENLENEKDSLQKRLEDVEQTHTAFQSEFLKTKEQLATTEEQLIETAQKYNTTKDRALQLSNELQNLTEIYEGVKLKLKNTENVMADTEAMKSEFKEIISTLQEECVENQTKVSELMSEIGSLNKEKTQLNENFTAASEEAANLKRVVSDFESRKASLENELEMVRKDLISKTELCQTQKSRVDEVQASYSKIKEDSEILTEEYKHAKELFINEKMTLQRQIEDLEEDSAKQWSLNQETVNGLESQLEQLEEKYDALKSSFNEKSRELQRKEQDWEKTSAHHIAQIEVFTGNIQTLREDLQSEQSKRENLEVKFDEITGNKLELQAKLENALEERGSLLERCLNSESECEKLQKSCVEMRKKYDDCVAALQELGRENQTLQVENMKHVSRKWADDSEATNCTTCNKLFTVTIRKHHCRNCGNIFCNECSSKTATVASSKKPVRVCEVCYTEVTKS